MIAPRLLDGGGEGNSDCCDKVNRFISTLVLENNDKNNLIIYYFLVGEEMAILLYTQKISKYQRRKSQFFVLQNTKLFYFKS